MSDYNGGWLDIPERHVVARTLQTYQDSWKTFDEPTGPIRLYLAWKDVLGSFPAYGAQAIGDCVSQGYGRGLDLLQALEKVMPGKKQDTYKEAFTEFTYGASRQIGGILGDSDGSFGSAAAAAAIKIGYVPRTEPYSGRRAKEWGRTGPPRELIADAKRIGGVAKITDWPGLVSALWNGYPVPVCSNQGFTMTRDREGFCRASGTWNHCMLIAGVRFDRPGALICQSWGANVPDGPLDLDQPDFSFWADKSTVERMLAQDDTFCLMDAPELDSNSRIHPYR